MRATEFMREYPSAKPMIDADIEIGNDDMELVEVANLPQEDTGVEGIIWISSNMAGHGPRVKWYPKASNSKQSACLSITISSFPTVINHHLADKIAKIGAGPASRWVILNHEALRKFWDHGYSWTRKEVNDFIDGLQKI